jgi:hypothetical protein
MGAPIDLITDTARVELDTPIADLHPDLLALAALTFIAPWCREELTFNHAVSEKFARAVHGGLGLQMTRVDPSLQPRTPGRNTGLMYSGGPDCMAAQVLLDTEVTYFHFRRVAHPRVPNRATGFKAGTQESLARRIQRRGEELHVARSDLEYLCRPFPTFPHWTSLSIGAILTADNHDLGAIVSGRNISGIYLRWGRQYAANGENESGWESMYEAAGMRLLHPLAGASDVLSKKIARSHSLHHLARSCVSGTLETPCFQCKKCLITELMIAADECRPLPEHILESLASSPKVTRSLSKGPPFDAHHLLAYTLTRVPGIESTFLGPLREVMQVDLEDTAWLERYYRPALVERLPPEVAHLVENRIGELAEFMTPADEARVTSWSAVT